MMVKSLHHDDRICVITQWNNNVKSTVHNGACHLQKRLGLTVMVFYSQEVMSATFYTFKTLNYSSQI